MDDNQEIIPPATSETPKNPWTKRLVVGGLAAAALAGVGAMAATANDFRVGPMHGFGPGHEMRGENASWRGGHGFGPRGINRMLDRVDATDEQKDKIEDIFESVRDDVRPLMREFRDARGDLGKLLSAPTVDAAALETLRAGRVAAIDEASRKLTSAIVQAAEVLTPEQRKELVERFEDRRGDRRW